MRVGSEDGSEKEDTIHSPGQRVGGEGGLPQRAAFGLDSGQEPEQCVHHHDPGRSHAIND